MTLLGTWVVDEADMHALTELGDVLMDFRADGQLVYTIRSDARDEIILLRYKVEGGTIVTDQPSAPRVERTAYSLSSDGVLTLEFGGVAYRFRRQRGRAEASPQDESTKLGTATNGGSLSHVPAFSRDYSRFHARTVEITTNAVLPMFLGKAAYQPIQTHALADTVIVCRQIP